MVLTDLFSIESTKCLVLNMLMGKNYRITTEQATKEKLFKVYSWLIQIHDDVKTKHGKNWRKKLFEEIESIPHKEKEEKNLLLWLLGLTHKTASNNTIRKEDFEEYLNEATARYDSLLSTLKDDEQKDKAWLLLMAGSATLNVRGSQKSTIGKKLENILVKTMLTLLGFEHEDNFWMNVGRDEEVSREVDAES